MRLYPGPWLLQVLHQLNGTQVDELESIVESTMSKFFSGSSQRRDSSTAHCEAQDDLN